MSDRMRRSPFLYTASLWMVISLLSLCCSACTALSSDKWTLLWFLIPLLGFGLTSFILVLYRRKAQIAAWDLRVSPEEPSAKGIILWTISAAAAASIFFAVYNLLLEMDMGQKVFNIGGWLLGIILGTSLAIYLGLRFAEPRSLPGRR